MKIESLSKYFWWLFTHILICRLAPFEKFIEAPPNEDSGVELRMAPSTDAHGASQVDASSSFFWKLLALKVYLDKANE